ncbi:MAG: hypothetical protein OEV44_11395 [Spirochaetota bacterium]|nr:hypothetical protein [Spirochaetota bacterium]
MIKKVIAVNMAVVLLFISFTVFSSEGKISKDKISKIKTPENNINDFAPFDKYLHNQFTYNRFLANITQFIQTFKINNITFLFYKQNVLSNSPMYRLMGGFKMPLNKNIELFYSINKYKSTIKRLYWQERDNYVSYIGLSF